MWLNITVNYYAMLPLVLGSPGIIKVLKKSWNFKRLSRKLSLCILFMVMSCYNVFLLRYFPSVSCRNSHPGVFWGKGVLKICSKFTGEHPCRSAISIKLLCNFIEIKLQQGCSLVNLLHIFRGPFLRTPLDGCFWHILRKTSNSSVQSVAEKDPWFDNYTHSLQINLENLNIFS